MRRDSINFFKNKFDKFLQLDTNSINQIEAISDYFWDLEYPKMKIHKELNSFLKNVILEYKQLLKNELFNDMSQTIFKADYNRVLMNLMFITLYEQLDCQINIMEEYESNEKEYCIPYIERIYEKNKFKCNKEIELSIEQREKYFRHKGIYYLRKRDFKKILKQGNNQIKLDTIDSLFI